MLDKLKALMLADSLLTQIATIWSCSRATKGLVGNLVAKTGTQDVQKALGSLPESKQAEVRRFLEDNDNMIQDSLSVLGVSPEGAILPNEDTILGSLTKTAGDTEDSQKALNAAMQAFAGIQQANSADELAKQIADVAPVVAEQMGVKDAATMNMLLRSAQAKIRLLGSRSTMLPEV